MDTSKNIDYSNVILVDVRSVEEFESGTAPGAMNIPLHTIADNIDRFKSMNKPVVVFCRSGARSGQATMWLKQQGIEVTNGGGLNEVMDTLETRA